MTKAIDKLTGNQVVALAALIESTGRSWRNVLDYAWVNGRYPSGVDSAALQQIRNQHGPSLILKLKTKDIQDAAYSVSLAKEIWEPK